MTPSVSKIPRIIFNNCFAVDAFVQCAGKDLICRRGKKIGKNQNIVKKSELLSLVCAFRKAKTKVREIVLSNKTVSSVSFPK